MTPSFDGDELGESVSSATLEAREVDKLFEVMADSTRRSAIRALVTADGAMAFEDLTGAVARDTTIEPLDAERKRRVATSLYHVHLPKLQATGVITEFDTAGTVQLCDQLDQRTSTLIESL